jgi:hypothetical protein
MPLTKTQEFGLPFLLRFYNHLPYSQTSLAIWLEWCWNVINYYSTARSWMLIFTATNQLLFVYNLTSDITKYKCAFVLCDVTCIQVKAVFLWCLVLWLAKLPKVWQRKVDFADAICNINFQATKIQDLALSYFFENSYWPELPGMYLGQ